MADGPTWPCQYQCDEERWAVVGKNKKFLALLWISRPSVCNLYSATKTRSYFPSRISAALTYLFITVTAHSSISCYLVIFCIFQKHFHQKYFLPIIFLCQGQLNDNQDPTGVGLPACPPSYIVASLQSQELLLRVKLSGEVLEVLRKV